MNHYYYWTSLFLLFAVVQHSAVAFKIPGLSGGSSSSSGGINRAPPGGVRGPATGTGGHRGPESEYMGPVFIIRELDRDKGEYDAFVTTGGIQEVRPPPMSDRSLPPQHGKPTAARDDEDAEHFGVLVTPETVKRLERDEKLRTSAINVTMAVLLSAASSRMPWLLVLHRKQYPHLFEYQQQQPQHQYPGQQQQQQHQYQHQHQQHQSQSAQQPQYVQPLQADAVQMDGGGIPGVQHPQIPQRRRYQTDRQRRGLMYASADDSLSPSTALEHQLLSTMCYNFVRDYYSSEPAPTSAAGQAPPGLPIALADAEFGHEAELFSRYLKLDANAYAAAATAPTGRVQKPPAQSPPAQPASTARPEEQSDGGFVGMEIPKRVS